MVKEITFKRPGGTNTDVLTFSKAEYAYGECMIRFVTLDSNDHEVTSVAFKLQITDLKETASILTD